MSTGGFFVRRYARVTSTNDLARLAAEAGERQGLWIVADEQTAGRGRHGRRWASPPGNFYGSLLLRPGQRLGAVASLSLVAGLAVAEAVEDLSQGRLRPRLKWPNDVLLGGAKFAGLLLEAEAGSDGRAAWVIVGLGVNLAWHPPEAPYPVTSLAAQGCRGIAPERFLEVLRPRLAERLAAWREGGFRALRADWLARAAAVGERIRVRAGNVERHGRFLDVDDDGALRLADEAGRTLRLDAGELLFAADGAGASSPPPRVGPTPGVGGEAA